MAGGSGRRVPDRGGAMPRGCMTRQRDDERRERDPRDRGVAELREAEREQRSGEKG
jgi:hypothetical protein